MSDNALFEMKSKTTANIITLRSHINQNEITNRISNSFDFDFNGEIVTEISIPDFPKEFNIGLIVGSSGSGKSSLLKLFGNDNVNEWKSDECVANHFDNFDDACEKLGAVGFNSIITWLKPYQVLSTGEKFRCDVARKLKSNSVIDEFTSVVNRECAISCSVSIAKYIRKHDLRNIVFASCHDDIIEYLQPDWIYNTDTKKLSVGRCVRQRPQIVLDVHQCSKQIWYMFKPYHYLSADLNSSADCYLVTYNMLPIGFGAVISMPGRFPNPLNKNDKRLCVSEHRTVVLPDYQGIGIGKKLSEYMAELYISQGYRYFSKTANPIIGEYRQRSNLWRATSTNLKKVKCIDDISEEEIRRAIRPKGRDSNYAAVIRRLTRLCYSHEYIGDENTIVGEYSLHKTKAQKLF